MTPTSPCSLTDEALAQRIRAWESLRSACLGSERTATGAMVRYRLDPGVAHALSELVEAEGRCCPSLSLDATVTLSIEAPESMRAWVASTFAADAPDVATTPGEARVGVDREAVEHAVRAHYASAARRAGTPGPPETNERREPDASAIGAGAYPPGELVGLPEQAIRSSIGCANPVAIAELRPGDVVVDLGSGAGIDVLLSARRVGPTGKVLGIDMTDEMLELARKHQADVGIDNAEFLAGRIDSIPVPDDTVDVVLSNCVIGLSPDKNAVFAETYRILRAGGRLAIADVVIGATATPEQRSVAGNWVSCVAGSLTRSQYRAMLEAAGFVDVSIEESHRVTDQLESVLVKATKPGG